MGVFIQITIVKDCFSPPLRQQIAEICPVDIFAVEDGLLQIKPEEECTLCELCLKIAPAGSIHIYKTYSDETLVSTGNDYE